MGFGFFRGDDYGGGYFVLGFEVEELDALGAAAGGADGFGVDADDLAELADDHEFGGVVDEVDAGDLALAWAFMWMTPLPASPATRDKFTIEKPRSAARFDQSPVLRSSNLASINRTITVKIIAVETPNISAPSAASSGPSSFHDGDIIRSP